jgi:thioredoxin 2
VVVTDQTFQTEILSHSGVVLLDCWAAWCGPCRMISPIVDQLAREFSGRVKVAKLNVDQNPMTASRYHVLSVPTMLFFKNGKVVQTLAGAYAKPEIERQLLSLL